MKRTLTPLAALTMFAGLAASPFTQATDLSGDDAKYITESAQGLMSELKLGDMAQQRASDQRVKAFGKQMVAEHGKDMQALTALAKQKQVRLPETMNADQRKEADKLAKLSGKAFDQEYVKYEVKDHREDIKEQQEEVNKTADADLKQFAGKELDTVTAHKKKIDALQAAIRQPP